MITFTVPGNPVGKGRPRVSRQGGFARMYTPEKTVSYENLVGWTAAQAMAGHDLIDGPVAVMLEINVPIPASWSQKKRTQALAGAIRPTTKPDIDNIEKAIFDALNGVVWKDDVQVVQVTKAKWYAAAPRVEVAVGRVAQQNSYPEIPDNSDQVSCSKSSSPLDLIERHKVELSFDGAEGGVWAANLAPGGDIATGATAAEAVQRLLEHQTNTLGNSNGSPDGATVRLEALPAI